MDANSCHVFCQNKKLAKKSANLRATVCSVIRIGDMKALATIILALIIQSCVVPMTSVIKVAGVIPSDIVCAVNFVNINSGVVEQANDVKGKYSVNMVTDISKLPINILLVCNDVVNNQLGHVKQSPIGNALQLDYK